MRKLMWFTIGFTVACVLGSYVFSAWLWIVLVLGTVGFAVAIFLRDRWYMKQVAAMMLGLSIGLVWFGFFHSFYLSSAAKADGTQLSMTALITDYGRATEYGTTVDAQISIDSKTYRAVLYLKDTHTLKPGDSVSGVFKLRMTHEGLEGDTYHRGSGVFLLAYAQEETVHHNASEISFRYFPAILRHEIVTKIETFFPDDVAFFSKALFLGDRSDVDYETNTAFKVSGISHIIAVSGLHVSILFSVIFLITFRRRLITVIVGIPVLVLFAAVTGFTPSVTRACVMQILFMLADLLLREYDLPTSLSVAVLLILAVNPVSATSVSLQLSAGCMMGIFLFSSRIKSWICAMFPWKNWKGKSLKVRIRNWFASGVSVTSSSMFFTAPLVAYYFGCVSLIGVFTNLLTLWAVSWIFYGIMIVCLMSLFWYQGAMGVAWCLSWLIRYVLAVSKSLAEIPLAAVYTKSGFVVCWIVLCYALVFLYLFWQDRKPYILVCSMLLSLSIALLLSWILPLRTNCRVTVFDVGQGQAILLQSKGKTFLVDCGGERPTYVADQVAETLLSMGIYRLDGVVLTHYDGDHSHGIPYLLSRIPADNVFLPESSENKDIMQTILDASGDASKLVSEDIHLTWENTTLSIFAPLSKTDDNESGLCILFRGENCDILITGDLSIRSENKLLLTKNIPELTALVIGHHGSPHSTGEGLLQVTKPEYCFISVGEDNPYGHPSQEVLDRLERYNCTVYRTDRDSTIVFRR